MLSLSSEGLIYNPSKVLLCRCMSLQLYVCKPSIPFVSEPTSSAETLPLYALSERGLRFGSRIQHADLFGLSPRLPSVRPSGLLTYAVWSTNGYWGNADLRLVAEESACLLLI